MRALEIIAASWQIAAVLVFMIAAVAALRIQRLGNAHEAEREEMKLQRETRLKLLDKPAPTANRYDE